MLKRLMCLLVMLMAATGSLWAQPVLELRHANASSTAATFTYDTASSTSREVLKVLTTHDNYGHRVVSTPTVVIGPTDVLLMRDYLPAGTVGYSIRTRDGDAVVNHPTNLATGSDYVGELVASGTTNYWFGLLGECTSAIAVKDTASVTVFLTAW